MGETPPPEWWADRLPNLELNELLGRGGMGFVYKARQKELNRDVAVKILSPERAEDPGEVERFLREAQALAKLRHPNIVAVHDLGRLSETAYFVMEYVDGESLRERLQAGSLPPTEALKLVPQLCEALQFAHDRGIVHRDIKPENVLIGQDGSVKIADFGLAKFDHEHSLTGEGDRMGTARYMAPEQWKDTASVDHRADIYSLGVMIYEMLTGDVPSPQCKPPSEKAGTDRRLDRIVSKSLQEKPGDRYQRAVEVRHDVERITAGRSSGPMIWFLAGLFVVILLAIAFWPKSIVTVPTNGSSTAASMAIVTTDPQILTSNDWEWSPPENLGPGVNTEYQETAPFLSHDGLSLYFASERPGGLGDDDLWYCQRTSLNEPFGTPTHLGETVNSSAKEGSPCVSADGLLLAFHSKRTGKFGIWLSERPTTDSPWGTAKSVGPAVRSRADDFRPWLSPDGLTLTFISHRDGKDGIFRSIRKSRNVEFESPILIGPAPGETGIGGPSFTADGTWMFLNRSDRSHPGDLLWFGRVGPPGSPFPELTSFGTVVNGPWIDVDPAPSADGKMVVFQSDRPGGQGNMDLWLTRRIRK